MSNTNYYEELGIESTSSLEEIKKSIKANRRRYRSLTGSPNIDQRSMADRKMVILAEAEKIFSDKESRQVYDELLLSQKEDGASQSDQTSSNNDNSSVDGDEFVSRARSAYEVGNLNLAAQYAQEATQINRNSLQAWKLRATIAEERNEFDEAEMACTEAAYIQSEDSEIIGLLGDIHYKQRKYSQATKDYEKAFQLSKNYYWRIQKANALYQDNKIVESAELFLSVSEQYSDSSHKAMILKSAALAYSTVGQKNKSKKILQSIVKLEPTFENKMIYAKELSGQEAVDYVQKIYPEYSQNSRMQDLLVETLFSNLVDTIGNSGSLTLDSKEKCQKTSEVLDKIRNANLSSQRALDRYNELERHQKYATKRHLQKFGCGTFIWIIAIYFIISWIVGLFADDSMGMIFGVVTTLYYILYFVYPKGWLINKRGE